jgi:hypothetical protein
VCHCVVGLHGCAWLWVAEFHERWRIEMAVFVLMNRAPNSASTMDDMTAQIICEILRTAPLLKGMLSFPAMNMCPPTRLQDFGSDKYDALLRTAKTMLLA